jgi:hypothetical protein
MCALDIHGVQVSGLSSIAKISMNCARDVVSPP